MERKNVGGYCYNDDEAKIQNDKSLKGGEKDDSHAKGQTVPEQNDAKGD